MTLIEVLIVIMVLAILASIAIPSYQYYSGLARSSRMTTYASAMMTAARLANYSAIAAQLPPNDLISVGDNLASFNWPKKETICTLMLEQKIGGPDAMLGPTSTPGNPITCNAGVLSDTSASGNTCKSTYVNATSETVSAYVDMTDLTAENCK